MSSPHDPYAALRHPGYRDLMTARIFYVLAVQMQTVAVSWQIYQRLHASLNQAALALGYIGLVQVIPVILLSLPAGHAADRFSRRTILLTTQLLFGFCSALLLLLTRIDAPVAAYYVVLFIAGAGRSFTGPAITAFYTMLVPRAVLPNASTWNSTFFQTASMVGPALGGIIVAQAGPETSYLVNLLCAAIGFALLLRVKPVLRPAADKRPAVTLESLIGGVRFVFKTRLLLAVLSLDLFCRAARRRDGPAADFHQPHPPWRGGHLRAFARRAFGWGHRDGAGDDASEALAARRADDALDRVGLRARHARFRDFEVILAVAGRARADRGRSTTSAWSFGKTLTQMLTPNEMRGRVSSVNLIFISCSNEFGEFESGITARLLGPVGSVLLGGIGTMLVVAAAAWLFPRIAAAGKIDRSGAA